MRYTKAMKIEQAKFAEQMLVIFTGMGAKPNEEYSLYQMTFSDTLAGPYQVTIYPGDSAELLGWIAGRFTDVEKAVALLGGSIGDPNSVNKCSGKWNHHFFHNKNELHTVDAAIEYMKYKLGKILK